VNFPLGSLALFFAHLFAETATLGLAVGFDTLKRGKAGNTSKQEPLNQRTCHLNDFAPTLFVVKMAYLAMNNMWRDESEKVKAKKSS
jgi:hypothetical protein